MQSKYFIFCSVYFFTVFIAIANSSDVIIDCMENTVFFAEILTWNKKQEPSELSNVLIFHSGIRKPELIYLLP